MTNVYVERFGSKTAPPLVLLHGWASNGQVWQHLVSELQAHFYVMLIDVPTLGRLDDLSDMSSSEAVDLIASVIPDQAACVGWSLGGQLMIQLAHQYPHKVKSLTLIASNPCFVQRDDWSAAMTQAVFDQFTQLLATRPSKTLVRFQRLQVLGSSDSAKELEFLQAVSKYDADTLNYETSLAWLSLDVRPLFVELACPIQVILGDGDTIVPVAVADAMLALQPKAEVAVVPGAGHLPFVTDGAQTLQLIHDFADAHG